MLEPKKYDISIELPPYVTKMIQILSEAGGKCYIWGGTVRDAMMGKQPQDYDLKCNLPIQKIASLLRENHIEADESFLEIKYLIAKIEGEDLDITSYDGERIDSSLQETDFTINALLYDTEEQCIVDYMGGKEDLDNKILRKVNADMGARGGKRIFRGIRFALQFGFRFDPDTYASMRKAVPEIADIKPSTLVKLMEKLLATAENALMMQPEAVDEASLTEEEQVYKKLAEEILAPHVGERPFIQALLNANIKRKNDRTIYLRSIYEQRTEGPKNAGSSFLPGFTYEDFLNAFLTVPYKDITDEAEKAGTLQENQHIYSLDIPGKLGIIFAKDLRDNQVVYAVDGHGSGTLEFGAAEIEKQPADKSVLIVQTNKAGNDDFAVTCFPGPLAKASKLERFGVKEGQWFTKEEAIRLCGEDAVIKFIPEERMKKYEQDTAAQSTSEKQLKMTKAAFGGKLVMSEYDPNWAVMGKKYVDDISSVMQKATLVRHIGSTAIKGMLAKPIIDVAVGIDNLDDVLLYVDALEKIDIHYDGEVVDGQREFHQDDPVTGFRLLHVHVCQSDSVDLARYVSVVDYCNTFPKARAAYRHLKEACLLMYEDHPEKYGAAKNQFMVDLREDALEWKMGKAAK